MNNKLQNEYIVFQQQREFFKVILNPNLEKPSKEKKVSSRPIYVQNKYTFQKSISKLPIEIVVSSESSKGKFK